MLSKLRHLLASPAVHLRYKPARFGMGELLVLQLLASKVRRLTLESRVVSKDPAVHILGIPKRMSRKPLHSQLGVCAARQFYQIKESKNGTMGSPDDRHGLRYIARDVRDEIAGFQNYV